MKTNLKALCAAGLLAVTMTAGVMLPGQAADKMAPKMDKMDGKMMSCPACKMMGNKMSDGDKKMTDHMMSMMSAADKKTYGAMSVAEKALVKKAMTMGMTHGKMAGKMMDHKKM